MDENTVMQQPTAEEAVRAARAEWEREAKAREAHIREEAIREAGMTAQERAQQEHARRSAELEARERALLNRELRADAGDELRRRELPDALMGAIDLSDAEHMRASLDRVETAYRDAVRSGIEMRMRGNAPRAAAAVTADADLSDADYYLRLK